MSFVTQHRAFARILKPFVSSYRASALCGFIAGTFVYFSTHSLHEQRLPSSPYDFTSYVLIGAIAGCLVTFFTRCLLRFAVGDSDR